MTAIYFVLALLAVVAFLLAAFNVPRLNWFALGFAFLAGILLFQYGAGLG
jgi:hypothetical protein